MHSNNYAILGNKSLYYEQDRKECYRTLSFRQRGEESHEQSAQQSFGNAMSVQNGAQGHLSNAKMVRLRLLFLKFQINNSLHIFILARLKLAIKC